MTGNANTAVGRTALNSNTTGFANAAFGEASLTSNTTGGANTAIGQQALRFATTGNSNTGIGRLALVNTIGGNNNVALGENAGNINTAGSDNTFIGTGSNASANNLANATAIGSGAVVSASNSIQLGNGSVTNVNTAGRITSATATHSALPSASTATDVVVAAAGGVLETRTTGSFAWTLSGNSGTTAGTNFIGTTDNQPIEIHVYDSYATPNEGTGRALQIVPNTGVNTAPSIIAGYKGNTIGAGISGSTIAGGGANGFVNTISSHASSIGGGNNNTILAGSFGDFIGGGGSNTASNLWSFVGGGEGNTASGIWSVVVGGQGNSATNNETFVGGGTSVQATGFRASVVGGGGNVASGSHSFIGNGEANTTAGDYTAIPGGRGLTLDAAADRSFGFLGGNTGANNMTISAPDAAVFGNTNMWLANNTNTPSQLRFYEANATASGAFPPAGIFFAAIEAPALAADYTLTLPVDDGAANQVLTTDGSGILSWSTAIISGSSAGGDLTGTYPNPTIVNTAGPNIVAALNNSGVASSLNADVLKYDATLTVAANQLGINLGNANSWTGAQTFSSVDINGGTIDGTTIGGSTAAAATVTNLVATGTSDLQGAVSNSGADLFLNDDVGIGTATPISQLANTTTNITDAGGDGVSNGSFSWETSAGGYVGAFYNADAASVNPHGLLVKVTKTTANTRAFNVIVNGADIFRVQGDGNTIAYGNMTLGDNVADAHTINGSVSSATGDVTINDDLRISGLNGLKITEGANGTMGIATLVAGAVTVNTTRVTANSRIFLTMQNPGGTPGFVYISARTAGTSFTITSSSGTDVSDVAWVIIEP